jgi:Fibronectin type III domain
MTATTVTGSPPATSTTITALTNGTSYTFKVTATNAIGTGPPSAASNAVTPSAAWVTPAFVQAGIEPCVGRYQPRSCAVIQNHRRQPLGRACRRKMACLRRRVTRL